MIPSFRNLSCRSFVPALFKPTLALGLFVLLAFAALAGAQTWTPLAHPPSFSASTALLLTDGSVMVQAKESSVWWRLQPDNTGSYINGTWSQLASLPAGYGPLYYASAVLPDGRVVIEGGEYNNGGNTEVWTALGALYNPATNSWTSIAAPAGWTNIGDAQSIVLPNGTFMLADPFNTQAALLNASTLTWTLTGSGKADNHDEEGWTLLPNGTFLTIDANNLSNLTNSEIYNPGTGIWSSAGSTIVKLPDTNANGSGSREIGPAILRPDGTVFATGATSNTAIYNPAFGSWAVGPTFPSGLDVADGPAALLPNGNVLIDSSPGIFGAGARFFEFNGASLTEVPAPPNASGEPSYFGRMLVLPTGQILFTDGSSAVEIYTASGTYQSPWQPTISSFPSTVTPGTTSYSISGTQFNGLSQGAMYGDDAQSATNYPLVRITNNATNHVSYAKTHNHSTMGVATGSTIVSTQFDAPAGLEPGASRLQVVANGIPSNAVTIQVLGSAGNPFVYASAADERQACYGMATRNSSYCASIGDFNDRQMCNGIAQSSQTPCTQITDRNLQLTCYGIAVKPNFPSNCRDITDPDMRQFCYGAAGVSLTDIHQCDSISVRNTQLLCYAMNDFISSNCRDISNANDRQFCYGVSGHDSAQCASIQ